MKFIMRVRMEKGNRVQKFAFDSQRELVEHLMYFDYSLAYTFSIIRIEDVEKYNKKAKYPVEQ